MWRRNALRFGKSAQENEDSDQSISEEEGLEDEWTGNAISLGGRRENEGRMQVLSQLETLRDPDELQSTEDSISSHECNDEDIINDRVLSRGTSKLVVSSHNLLWQRKGGYCIDDEVDDRLFNDGDGSSCYPRVVSATHTHSEEGITHLPTKASIWDSDEEIISDDEKINPPILRTATQNAGGTWSEASREAEAIVCLNENSSCSSSHGVRAKENKSSKGAGCRTKAKTKFLFRFHSRNKDPSLVVDDENGRTSSNNIPQPDEICAAADKDTDTFMADSQLTLHEKESEKPENHTVPSELAHEHDFKEHSVAEFLDCFQGKNNLQGSSKLVEDMKSRGRRSMMFLKRNTLSLGDRNLNDDDLSDSGRSDDEENPASRRPITLRTMVDQFHEAFGTVTVIDERPLCSGLYEKLQRAMQIQKERDVDYLKNISTSTVSKDERMCISMRILSRSLEAKLIVCSCTSIEDGKNSCWESNLHMKIGGVARTLTIIFNPRVCSDVELEVGNLIRIHPPWKEVQVKERDEVILLCSYFSPIEP